MLVVGGTSGEDVAQDLARELDAGLVPVESRRFPDGEAYVRLEQDVAGEEVVVVQTTHPDEALVEMLLLLDAARRSGASRVVAAIPYMGYARQDKVFQPGEPLSAAAVAGALGRLADGVIAVNVHKRRVLEHYGIPAVNASAIPEIARYFAGSDVDLVLAPDKGAMPHAEVAARILHADADHLEKTRLSDTKVEVKPKDLDVRGGHVLLLDDIISTGGTMRAGATALKGQGASSVAVACVHGLFLDEALAGLQAAGCDEVVATNSLQNPVEVVSVAPAIARGVRELEKAV